MKPCKCKKPYTSVTACSHYCPVARSLLPWLPAQCEVKEDSPLIGQSIRDAHFRSRFSAAVVAVKRSQPPAKGLLGRFKKPAKVQVPGRLGDITLQAGDELLLDIGGCKWVLHGDRILE